MQMNYWRMQFYPYLKMKKVFFTLLILFLVGSFAQAKEEDWRVTKSTHFIIFSKKATPEFINNVISNCERYYEKIADALGFRRFHFWLWENRAKIYIYNDAAEYRTATGQPEWSFGSVTPNDKIINTFVDAPNFFDTILPHEMGHIIFREFVGFNNKAVPLWLDEGVATFQETFRYDIAGQFIKQAMEKNDFISLDALFNFDPHSNEPEKVGLFYAEAVSIVKYLIREHGSDHFALFCQYLRDKKDFARALILSYPLNSVKNLEEEWIKSLKK